MVVVCGVMKAGYFWREIPPRSMELEQVACNNWNASRVEVDRNSPALEFIKLRTDQDNITTACHSHGENSLVTNDNHINRYSTKVVCNNIEIYCNP